MRIQLTRNVTIDGVEVANGTKLSEKDISRGELQSLVGTGWAFEIKASKKQIAPDADDVDEDEDEDLDKAEEDVSLIRDLSISKNAIAALRKEGIETLNEAAAYIAEHGSLEPIKGVSKEAADIVKAAVEVE